MTMIMHAAEFRARRELSGLTGVQLAGVLSVNPRTVGSWEQGRDRIPAGIAEQMRGIESAAREAVTEMAESAGTGPLLTYRTDEQYRIYHPQSPWSAAWHRAVTARAAEETGLPVEYAPELVEIASHIPGRDVHSYELLDEVVEATGMAPRDAHDAIHAMLEDLIEIGGEEIIVGRRPIRPELLRHNSTGRDVYWWLAVTELTAREIGEALTASQPE